MLICIDIDMNMIFFDMVKLKLEKAKHSPLQVISIYQASRFFDLVLHKDEMSLLLDRDEDRARSIADFRGSF